MNRRDFIIVLAGAGIAVPALTQAQQARKVPVVGFLHPGFADTGSPALESLRQGLLDAGYREGQTIRVESRWANGRPEILPRLARELIELRVDILVPTARPSIEAARAATSTVPIVANDLESDPVASGYVASLAHPGGNLTGLFLDAPTLCGKWLQQMGEVVPGLSKVAALWDATTGNYQLDAIKAAAKAASVELRVMEFSDDAGLESALALGLKETPQAVVLLGSPLIRQGASRIAVMLSTSRIPAISPFRTFPDAGGLMSYGPDLIHLYRSIGAYLAKILEGARPGDLPVQRPTKFDLIVNLKAAKALGVTMPGSFLAGADEVIE
jgi:putative ABC transport system substrate-binding protein